MTDPSLAELLDEYAGRIRNLPVPVLVDPADDPSVDQHHFDDAMTWRAFGLTVADRLLPGATAEQIEAYEEQLGVPLPPECREWFEWSNGQVGGLGDMDDHVACLFPYGRQLDLDASLYVASTIPAENRTEVELPCYVIQMYWMNLVVECGREGQGAVWFHQLDSPPMEKAFGSLFELVRQAHRLLDLGWIHLNNYGTPTLVREDVLEREGVVFTDKFERYWYRSYGRIPQSVAGNP